jgi:hypothetical protein
MYVCVHAYDACPIRISSSILFCTVDLLQFELLQTTQTTDRDRPSDRSVRGSIRSTEAEGKRKGKKTREEEEGGRRRRRKKEEEEGRRKKEEGRSKKKEEGNTRGGNP